MRLIITGILVGVLLTYFILKGKDGIGDMKKTLTEFVTTTEGKIFLIIVTLSVIFMTIMLF